MNLGVKPDHCTIFKFAVQSLDEGCVIFHIYNDEDVRLIDLIELVFTRMPCDACVDPIIAGGSILSYPWLKDTCRQLSILPPFVDFPQMLQAPFCL